MNERPILFSAPMVRALLDGSKTQTRRAMNPQPPENWAPASYGDLHGYDRNGQLTPDKVVGWGPVNEDGDQGFNCRYGQPGDRLWVREAWRVIDLANCFAPREITAAHRMWFEADGPHEPPAGRYRPGMFMPRWASRITLEVAGVRVERLQDISEADAQAEGCERRNDDDEDAYVATATYRQGYRQLWNSINGAGSWDLNPWVWVVEFKRISA